MRYFDGIESLYSASDQSPTGSETLYADEQVFLQLPYEFPIGNETFCSKFHDNENFTWGGREPMVNAGETPDNTALQLSASENHSREVP